MVTTEIATSLIDPKTVTKAYRGRIGCACGCRGTYADAGTQTCTSRVNAVNRAIAAGKRVTLYRWPEGGAESCYEWEYDGKVVLVYTDEGRTG